MSKSENNQLSKRKEEAEQILKKFRHIPQIEKYIDKLTVLNELHPRFSEDDQQLIIEEVLRRVLSGENDRSFGQFEPVINQIIVQLENQKDDPLSVLQKIRSTTLLLEYVKKHGVAWLPMETKLVISYSTINFLITNWVSTTARVIMVVFWIFSESPQYWELIFSTYLAMLLHLHQRESRLLDEHETTYVAHAVVTAGHLFMSGKASSSIVRTVAVIQHMAPIMAAYAGGMSPEWRQFLAGYFAFSILWIILVEHLGNTFIYQFTRKRQSQ